jgi:hypothetical protein
LDALDGFKTLQEGNLMSFLRATEISDDEATRRIADALGALARERAG